MSEKLVTKKAVKQVLGDYWSQLWKHPFWALFMLFAPGIGSILVFYIPTLVIARLVDLFAEKQAINLEISWPYILAFCVVWLAGEAFWRIGIHYLIKTEVDSVRVLSKKAFKMLSARDYAFYTDNFVGTLTKRASAYSRNFSVLADILTFGIISNIIPMIFAFVILWRYSPWIPLVLFFSLVVMILVAYPLIKIRVKLTAERHDANSKMMGRLSDSVTNILAIKSFAKEKNELKFFSKHVDDFADKDEKTENFQNLRYDIIVSPVYVLTNVFGLIMAIYFAQTSGLQAGVIVVVFSYFSQVTRVFWSISNIYRRTEFAIGESAEFTQMFVEDPATKDKKGARKLKVSNGEVRFNKVAFKYCDDEAEKCFINDFNLRIKPRERIGLVGPSGGGKTTVTKLLLRFADPVSGDIIIDNQKIKNVTQESLRQAISYVPQESLLFHRTLYENISYGDEKAPRKEVLKAAKLARADEFISQLPNGYETLVGERGIKLSGGQRQRVAIARAILKKSPLLVLDEATSSLDSESEKYIQEGLWELMKNRTAVVIAHRLSTIKHLDRILVLDQGQIVQDGTHEDLIKEEGLYKKLWDHQAGAHEELI